MGRRKLTHAEQVEAINKVNPDVEVLGEIKGSLMKVLCRCKICGHKWNANPSNLKNNKTGCPACARKRITKSHEEHLKEIKAVNPDVEVVGKIKNTDTKVLCRCKICGHKWEARPINLKNGSGCPKCKIEKQRFSHAKQVEIINKVNPNVEVLGKIINNKTKVLCRCKICGYEWGSAPHDLKKGFGCRACKIKACTKSHEEHLKEIKAVNKNIEVLEKIKKSHTKVLCRCKICRHEWNAAPFELERGKGCPRCAKYGFKRYSIGKLYIMVDDLDLPTMMKIGVSVQEDKRSEQVLKRARKAGVFIPALHVAKTWEGPTELMMRIEQMMHENYAEWNIKFPAKFSGHTEFFYYTPETAGVFDAVNEIYYTVVNQF